MEIALVKNPIYHTGTGFLFCLFFCSLLMFLRYSGKQNPVFFLFISGFHHRFLLLSFMLALSSAVLVFPPFRRSSFIFHAATSLHKKSALKLQGGFDRERNLRGIPSYFFYSVFSSDQPHPARCLSIAVRASCSPGTDIG